MSSNLVLSDFKFTSNYVDVLGSKIHYIDQGEGLPILFLHGMPTSSYLWRNIIPHLSKLGRCVALDLIGMGKSDKPDIEYTIEDHIRYVEHFIETLGLKKIILIMHGWGSIIGFDYAMRHENNCHGLIFYESYLRSVHYNDNYLPFHEQITHYESPENKADVLQDPAKFTNQTILQGMTRHLSAEETHFYREPFLQKSSGKPLHQYLHELPSGKGETKADKIIHNYSEKLIHSALPKLMLYSIPGFATTIADVEWAKQNFLTIEITDIGEALHYAQENNPDLMGEIMSVWLQGLHS